MEISRVSADVFVGDLGRNWNRLEWPGVRGRASTLPQVFIWGILFRIACAICNSSGDNAINLLQLFAGRCIFPLPWIISLQKLFLREQPRKHLY